MKSQGSLSSRLAIERVAFLRNGDPEVWSKLIHSNESIESGRIERDLFARCWRRGWKIERNLRLEKMKRDVVGRDRGVGENDDASPAVLVYSDECAIPASPRSEEHTSELQSQSNLVCR